MTPRQPDRISLPLVILATGTVLIMLLVVLTGSGWIVRHWENRGGEAASLPEGLPPQPAVDGTREWLAYRAREDSLLASYGWQDSAAGLVRIPVESAMTLAIRRGLRLGQKRDRP